MERKRSTADLNPGKIMYRVSGEEMLDRQTTLAKEYKAEKKAKEKKTFLLLLFGGVGLLAGFMILIFLIKKLKR